ncbi:MAG: DUF4852 domain-containing protein [Pseudomonadota bacterium]
MRVFYLLSFFAILNISPALAQSDDDNVGFTTQRSVQFKDDSFVDSKSEVAKPAFFRSEDIEMGNDVTIIEDKYAGQHLSSSVSNLSKLYWSKGMLDITNDKAIDNFLLINECGLYESYYKDDFEWARIREAARDMLKNTKDTFTSKYKFLVPIDLGKYDLDERGFPLINNTAFSELRRVEVGGGENDKAICGAKHEIEGYPRNIVLILNKPFNLEFLPVDEHVAQAFLIRRKYSKFETTSHARYVDFERIAFARLRINITNFKGLARGKDHSTVAVMFGSVEGIDVFEDPYEKRLINTVDF